MVNSILSSIRFPEIQDVYLALCYLEAAEEDRIIGPPAGHEEILFLLEGKLRVTLKDKIFEMNKGEVCHLSDGQKATLKNLTAKKIYFIIAGGHTIKHSHD
ncbi:MAG: hypothetical protein ACTSRS_09770 [Candidatus Helarchaeota archaeon]